MTLPHIAHAAGPFSLSGSAITHVIRHLAREHAVMGGRSSVILSQNRHTVVNHAENLYVDHQRYCRRTWFTTTQMGLDHAAGMLGLSRPYTSMLPVPGMQCLEQQRPEIVLVHEGHYASSAIPRWRRALPESRLILYVHTALSRSYTRPELRRLLRPLDGIVYVSEYMAELIRTRVPNLAVPTAVVLNGTEPDQHGDRSTPDGDASLRVLFCGKITPNKGAHVVVAAAAALLREGADVRTRIVGSSVHGSTDVVTDYERELRAVAAPFGDRIQFVPFQPREALEEHRQWATVVCVPSLFDDPCPLVLLESMASSKAIVVSRRGGIPEIGQSAVHYVDPCDAAGLADALRTLGRDPRRRRRLAAAAGRRAQDLRWSEQYRLLMEFIASTSGLR